jgi:hypothetical protein
MNEETRKEKTMTTKIMLHSMQMMLSRGVRRTAMMIKQPAAPFPPHQISVVEEETMERDQILRVLEVETCCPKVSIPVMLILRVLEVATCCPKVSIVPVMLILRVLEVEMTSCPKVSTPLLLQEAAGGALTILLPAVEGQNAEIHCREASIRLVLVVT